MANWIVKVAPYQNTKKIPPLRTLRKSGQARLVLVRSHVLSLQFGKAPWENPIRCTPEESSNWQELYRVSQDGLPWRILATDATVDWEDKAGLKIKPTGKKNRMSRNSAGLPALPGLYCCDSTNLWLPCG